jgi:hypothetical protein
LGGVTRWQFGQLSWPSRAVVTMKKDEIVTPAREGFKGKIGSAGPFNSISRFYMQLFYLKLYFLNYNSKNYHEIITIKEILMKELKPTLRNFNNIIGQFVIDRSWTSSSSDMHNNACYCILIPWK